MSNTSPISAPATTPTHSNATAAAPGQSGQTAFGRETAFESTGFASSGNPMIDRMIRLERALKLNGSYI